MTFSIYPSGELSRQLYVSSCTIYGGRLYACIWIVGNKGIQQKMKQGLGFP